MQHIKGNCEGLRTEPKTQDDSWVWQRRCWQQATQDPKQRSTGSVGSAPVITGSGWETVPTESVRVLDCHVTKDILGLHEGCVYVEPVPLKDMLQGVQILEGCQDVSAGEIRLAVINVGREPLFKPPFSKVGLPSTRWVGLMLKLALLPSQSMLLKLYRSLHTQELQMFALSQFVRCILYLGHIERCRSYVVKQD